MIKVAHDLHAGLMNDDHDRHTYVGVLDQAGPKEVHEPQGCVGI